MVKLTIKFECSQLAEKKAEYILNLIAAISGLRFQRADSNPDIIYGSNDTRARLNIPQIDYSIKKSDWILVNKNKNLMMPGFISSDLLQAKSSTIKLDFFSLAFELLKSGLENIDNPIWSPDKLKTRLPYMNPYLNGYIDLFIESLKTSGLVPAKFRRVSPWPAKAEFAVGISHDIDIFKRTVMGSMPILVKSIFTRGVPGGIGGSVAGLYDSIKTALLKQVNPYQMISRWFDIESSATYFVFSGKRHSPKDPTYKPSAVAGKLKAYDNSRYEIGLHNSIGTWKNKNELINNQTNLSEIFQKEINGIRPHYLDCKYPEFWKNIASFSYSSAVGSDTYCGFPAAINFPFFGFDFETALTVDILELPVGLMDCALMNIKDEPIREKTIDVLIDLCTATNGLLVLDWHTRTAYDPDFPGWFAVYCSILEKAKSAGAYIASLGEINRYWRKYCTSAFLS